MSMKSKDIKDVKEKDYVGLVFAIIILLFAIIIYYSSSVRQLASKKQSKDIVIQKQIIVEEKDVSNLPVVRRTFLPNGNEYSENYFYQGDKLIATEKVKHGKVIDFSGNIPTGEVKFYDQYRKTYGEEFFVNNKRNGYYKEYYPAGQIRVDAKYSSNNLMVKKEYYIDGTLSLEVDYSDASLFAKVKDVGRGKTYYRDGSLKYEWNVTTKDLIGYQKTYSNRGNLTYEVYYDQEGNVVEKK